MFARGNHTRVAQFYVISKNPRELKIYRYILTDSYVKLMLLGYADASESAYGAVVYMHCVKEDNTITIKLIDSTSLVSLIKNHLHSSPLTLSVLAAGSISRTSSPLSTSTFS
ncbi:hypothetical protein TNCV_3523211 [Trichonephila clavipes]|uniref:Uncharacterized protein n=1 Tax=Trichonephila clavipes TaxID=2585209 RepID=A0A8X7BGR2_TRICX|nr:hypothetical protein TNCV_3523211 [Trichonephila clavipes]